MDSRDQAVEGVLGGVGSGELGGHALGAEGLDVGDGLLHARPVGLEEGLVVGVAVVVRDGPDVLALAVVLGDGVGAAFVDDAGDFAAVELVGGAEPESIQARDFFGVAAGEEGRRRSWIHRGPRSRRS